MSTWDLYGAKTNGFPALVVLPYTLRVVGEIVIGNHKRWSNCTLTKNFFFITKQGWQTFGIISFSRPQIQALDHKSQTHEMTTSFCNAGDINDKDDDGVN